LPALEINFFLQPFEEEMAERLYCCLLLAFVQLIAWKFIGGGGVVRCFHHRKRVSDKQASKAASGSSESSQIRLFSRWNSN